MGVKFFYFVKFNINYLTKVILAKRNVQNQKDFTQLILKSERPFYDIFGVNVELFHRTWREMHANVDDLDKV